GRRSKLGTYWSSYHRWYRTAVAGVLMCASVVPASGLFKHSWHVPIDRLNTLGKSRTSSSIFDSQPGDQDHYAAERRRLDGQNPFFSSRAKLRIAYQVEYGRAQGGSRYSNPDRWLDGFLPFYSEPVESLRDQTPRGCSLKKGCADASIQ